MPRTRPSATEERRRIIRACVISKRELNGWNDAQLAAKCRMSVSTIERRLEKPEKFTLEELWGMGITVYVYDGQSLLPSESGAVKIK